MIHVVAFYLFATIVVCSGALTILSRNPVHSVLWLILAFLSSAGLFVLLYLDVHHCLVHAINGPIAVD